MKNTPRNNVSASVRAWTNASKQHLWSGFIRKQRRLETVPELLEVIKVVRAFLMPIINDTAMGRWKPEDGWQ